jgi:hypothetical protein
MILGRSAEKEQFKIDKEGKSEEEDNTETQRAQRWR